MSTSTTETTRISAEPDALAGAPPDLVQAMHALKAPLAGRVVAVELGA